VVWFKRDLRLHDHAALHAALNAEPAAPLLCLYVVEPDLWRQPDAAAQHYSFIQESLADLRQALRAAGADLLLAVGDVTDVLQRLYALAPFTALYAHEETGNGWTYARDLRVGRWCREQGVGWHEVPQFSVVRRLRNRDHWLRACEAHRAAPQLPQPLVLPADPFRISSNTGEPLHQAAMAEGWATPLDRLPPPEHWGMTPAEPPLRQRGGRSAGLAVLHSFLQERSARYRGGIGSPNTAPEACSRLSAYLSYGCLSLREVVQATRHALQPGAAPATAPSLAPRATPAVPMSPRQRQGLNAFSSRLYWHCHFIQKLESEPELEWRNLHRGYDGLREDEFNEARFQALRQARTGWPMVDACVVMLRETGWLNFRMRAMLVSVAAYPLWLHWRRVGEWLAQQFLDYEPGIHWSQMQMQSGTTGINTTRVYNPIKQAQDHDPQGVFVRRWLPAMRRVPDSWLFEPWRMPPDVQARCGVVVGQDIPLPVVELESATRLAKARLHERRALPHVQAAKAQVVQRHGSRKGMPGAEQRDADPRAAGRGSAQGRTGTRGSTHASTPASAAQLTLDF
jgi:deoxyribodipyrimidine photo-lyase